MKFKNLGAFYRVTASKEEVIEFKSEWPCSGLPNWSISFEFDSKNGDLVGVYPDSAKFDGPALVALSENCQQFGEWNLNNPTC